MILPIIVYFAATALNVLAGQIPRPNGPRWLALFVALPSLAAPFVPGLPKPVTFIQGGLIAIQIMRVAEIARAPLLFGRGERAFRVLFPYETRAMKRVPRRFPVVAFLGGAAVIALGAAICVAGAMKPAAPYAATGWPRWLAAAVGCYVILEGAAAHVRALLGPFGWEHAPIQRAPILSRSLAEFWGVRWNAIISSGLRRNFFAPLARRRAAALGVLASFGLSALGHFYMVLPAAGLVPALWVGAFFLAHGFLTLVEARFHLRSRLFTFGAFAATLPLFGEPVMRGLGL